MLLLVQRLLSAAPVPDTRKKEEGMRFIARLRPSPALVVASLALLVALGGTSLAAVALVPRNSVGSAQVIDGSLQSNDLAGGQVLAGRGTLTRSIDGPVTPRSSDDPVGTLEIPQAGAYVIWAKAQVDGNHGGQCTLIAHGIPNGAGGIPDRALAQSIVETPTSPTLWTSVVHGFASTGGSVDLLCVSGSKLPFRVRDIRITAFRIGS